MSRARGGRAVMEQRLDPVDALDDFPTPPWGTRAFCRHILKIERRSPLSVWEPACGRRIMADVLAESFGRVWATDVHDYWRAEAEPGRSPYPPDAVGSFTGEGPDVLGPGVDGFDWIITNPPFNAALDFARRALPIARRGVALLVRSSWLEGKDRYRGLFAAAPPSVVAIYSERLSMRRGRYDPKLSAATSYSWVVWRKRSLGETSFQWIPPGAKAALTSADDSGRFAHPARGILWEPPEEDEATDGTPAQPRGRTPPDRRDHRAE